MMSSGGIGAGSSAASRTEHFVIWVASSWMTLLGCGVDALVGVRRLGVRRRCRRWQSADGGQLADVGQRRGGIVGVDLAREAVPVEDVFRDRARREAGAGAID